MRPSHRTVSVVPFGADQTLFVVVDRVGAAGRGSSEAEIERTDFEGIISDLLSGQFGDPIRVVAFNTLNTGPRTFRPMSPVKSRPAPISMAKTCRITSRTS